MSALNLLRGWTFALACMALGTAAHALWKAQATAAGGVELVPVIDRAAIKELIRQGRRVVFVDAREEAEFNEEHLPGARNITLRDIEADKVEELKRADVVVAYCLKDFRGFEVAKRLGEAGIGQVKIMQPFGLNGWKAEHLPTAGKSGVSEADAWQRLTAWSKGAAR